MAAITWNLCETGTTIVYEPPSHEQLDDWWSAVGFRLYYQPTSALRTLRETALAGELIRGDFGGSGIGDCPQTVLWIGGGSTIKRLPAVWDWETVDLCAQGAILGVYRVPAEHPACVRLVALIEAALIERAKVELVDECFETKQTAMTSDKFIERSPRWMLRFIADSFPVWYQHFTHRRAVVHMEQVDGSAQAAGASFEALTTASKAMTAAIAKMRDG